MKEFQAVAASGMLRVAAERMILPYLILPETKRAALSTHSGALWLPPLLWKAGRITGREQVSQEPRFPGSQMSVGKVGAHGGF